MSVLSAAKRHLSAHVSDSALTAFIYLSDAVYELEEAALDIKDLEVMEDLEVISTDAHAKP